MQKIAGIFFILIFGGVSIFAWDDAGHKISAEIAWRNMTPAAREKAVAVLLGAPEDSGILNLLAADSRSVAARYEQMFYTAATWADLIRDQRFASRYKEYHRGNWHYFNTFWRDANGKIEIATELKPDSQNIVERLSAFDKTLSDAALNPSDRAIALAWILHLAGDIHQPLHCSGRVTELEPAGDQGGNLFLISPADAPPEKRDNLHWYWDSIISRSAPRVGNEDDTSYIARLTDEIVKKYPAKDFADALKPGKFEEWQREGFDIASREVYPATLRRHEPPAENYRQRTREIAEKRLALAGYRMAEMFNRIFAA